MTEETLEQRFEEAIKGVREYCSREEVQLSSRLEKDFDAYRSLVALGEGALPLLRGLIGKEENCRWQVILVAHEILRNSGDQFGFPTEIRGKLDVVEAYLSGYLDCYLAKKD